MAVDEFRRLERLEAMTCRLMRRRYAALKAARAALPTYSSAATVDCPLEAQFQKAREEWDLAFAEQIGIVVERLVLQWLLFDALVAREAHQTGIDKKNNVGTALGGQDYV